MIVQIPEIGSDFNTARAMVSGVAQQAAHVYEFIQGRCNRWCVAADVEARAEYIYVDGGEGSRGFGGRVMEFPLVKPTTEGSVIKFHGPWHSNAEALWNDTGVDLRDKYTTYCVIAAGRGQPYWSLTNVLWRDEAPVIGTFDRDEVKAIAQEIANRRGTTVFFFKESAGGSSNTPVEPK